MAQLSNLIVNGVTRLLSKLYVSDSVTAPNFIGKLTGTAAKLGRNGDADTPMTFNWSGKDGQPTWLWGGENGSDMYVYNPSNFSVKNAKAAGSADSATKLSSSAGSATQPVYFSDGKPVATTYTLGKSVPASAVFTDTNTWRGVQNNLTSTSTDQSLSAAQGKVLKDLIDGKAPTSHTHSQYYDSTISRTKGTVLAAPASANGVATFRTLTKSDVGLGSVDNTADSAKSVKYATSAGSAGSATKANCVADYNATSKSIQIGYSGDGITGDAIKYIAGYTTGDGGDVSAKIKDISKDTLQSLLNMDDKYLACLVNENGQLSLNVDSFQQLAEARLNDAKAAAVEQAMQELNAVASQTEATAAANSITAIANKGAAVDTLAIKYTNLGNCAAYAAQAQAMADAYTAAAAKDATAADNIMAGLNAKLGLIDSTMNSIKSSATGAGNALGGYSNAASKASKASDALKDSLEKQKEAAEDAKDELEAYSNKLKIWGEAATKELDKRKKALEDQKDAQDKLYDDEIDRLKADQDAKDEAFDKEKKRLNEEKKLQDKLYKQQKEELQNQKELQDEVYQKQIDALKEKKQALQDANDEEDRAIKLAELQDALEKAKSQRTMRVYQHDTGFEWQTNENDVSNAQNALDDQQRTWKREDAIKAIEDEIDAIEKLKDAYDDQIDAKIDALDKEKDAYDEWIDGRLNQIETEKDAFDEMIDGQIEDIEKRQEAFDAEMDAEMDKLDELKDKYQEAMDLIGTSWEDYQEQLKAAAAFQEMSFADMSSYVSGYKDNVLANMQQIAEAEKQVNAITEQLAGLDDSSGSGSGGGGGGGSGGGLKALCTAAEAANYKINDLKDRIIELGDKNNDLKTQQQDLQDQLATLTEGTIEHTEVMNQLGEVQDQIAANTTELDSLTQQYIETVSNETEATQTDRDTQIRMITELMDRYGISYDRIAGYLSDYVNNVGTATISADGSYRTMADTIMGFCRSAQDQIHGTTSYIDELIAKCGALVKACNGAQQAQRELEARQAYNANARANGQNYTNRVAASGVQVKGGFASGSNRVGGPGIYSVDEHGNELIQRTRTLGNGRYVQLEYGDAVYPAKATKNLFDIGANPIGWMKDNISKIVGDFGAIKAVNGHQFPINLTFGDIIVQKPVGNADDLAQSLMQNLPTSFIQELGRNR